MTYVKVNVNKSTRVAPGKGGGKKTLVTFVDVADLVTEASRDSKGILISENHVFKANAYAIQIYATPNTISGKSTSEGDIDSEGFMGSVVFDHPGSELAIREFRSNWLSRDILIFVDHCEPGIPMDQYGSSCAPMRMKVEAVDDKDVNKSSFIFTSSNKGLDTAMYEGTLTLADVVATIPADATTVNLVSGEGEYQLTNNTAAKVLTTCINAIDKMKFTLLGSGGTNPATISDANDFVLANGTGWTGLAGASITFKAFKDGGASWKFFEVSRA